MNKNTIIGIVLMIALFVGFSFYQSYEMEKQQEILNAKAKKEQAERAQRIAEAEAERLQEEQMTEDERRVRDSLAGVEKMNAEVYHHGATLYAATTGESHLETLSNEFMSVAFDNRGGKIVDVTLNNYTRYEDGERDENVKLLVPSSA